MRIASKWLRYTLEIFSRLYSNKLKSYIQVGRKIQESLGTIHDDDVWLQVLPVIGEKERKKTLSYYGDIRPINRLLPGFEYFQQLCQKEREKTYREFVQDWQRWKERGLWEKLRQTIELPVTISANIYPPPAPVEEIS
jgi:CHAD domain-containing protein